MRSNLTIALAVLLFARFVFAQEGEHAKDRPGNNYSISNPLTLPSPPRGRGGCGSYFLDDPNPVAEQTARPFQVPGDLLWEQLLSEPVVRQPVFLNFDERGRMWVVQYRQYPHPAGLRIVSRDNYWRNVYNKIPPPPPRHFVGKDCITIHEDTDGDGRFDKHKTFVEGLNIATAVCRGRGGVWVLNPPYLLFYPDRNHDDLPDSDPEVRLQGFGLEDTHSVVNSLQWGPDGWLYAAQGSTVTARVSGPGLPEKPILSMGQLIWRYHPEQRRYEIFAEGGGNAFGVEIDSKGRIFSGHNGGDTRGFHYVQGGYLRKGFSKHGPLSNPYAFGYFEGMKHHSAPRFTHTFVVYEGGALSARYAGRLFGAEPLQGRVVMSDFQPRGATFQTRDLGFPVTGQDGWFRPVDIKVGPDGAIYVADWYDQQVNHYRNHEGKIDPDKGRIYRLRDRDSVAGYQPFDLSKRTSDELVDLLESANKWYRRMALRLLADRKDASVAERLERNLQQGSPQLALESLWALNLIGRLDQQRSRQLLEHPDPHVRLWVVRLMGDDRQVAPQTLDALLRFARGETNVEVRGQLACAARRLPAAAGLAIVTRLLEHEEDLQDPYLPLLLWWAIESKCGAAAPAVVKMFSTPAVRQSAITREFLMERVMRRFALAGARNDLLVCARLLETATDDSARQKLLAGLEAALKGRSLAAMPPELLRVLRQSGDRSLALQLRGGDARAVDQALTLIADRGAAKNQRLELMEVLAETKEKRAASVLLQLVKNERDEQIRRQALAALQAFEDDEIGLEVVRIYPDLRDAVRDAAQALLTIRPHWSRRLLEDIQAGKISKQQLSLPAVRKILLQQNSQNSTLVAEIFGPLQGATPEQMRNRIKQLTQIVQAGNGSPYEGKKLFQDSCGKCHTLFGEGGKIGPDLSSFKRDDLATMLLSIVNPNAEIREGFATHLVHTDDGRALTGLLVDQDNQIVVLRAADGQNQVIARDEIESMKAVGASMMPEGLLDTLAERPLRDLFAYLRSTQPLNN